MRVVFAALVGLALSSAAVAALPGMQTVNEYVAALMARTPIRMGSAFEVPAVRLIPDEAIEVQITILDRSSVEIDEAYWSSLPVMALETTFCANEAQAEAYQVGIGLRFVYLSSDFKTVMTRDVSQADCTGMASTQSVMAPAAKDPEDELRELVVQARSMPREALDTAGTIANDGAWLTGDELAFQLMFLKLDAAKVRPAWFESDFARALAVMHCGSLDIVQYAFSSGRTVLLHYVDRNGAAVRDVRLTAESCDALNKKGVGK